MRRRGCAANRVHGPGEECASCSERVCALAEARAGDLLTILDIEDEPARIQALRFGMGEGACVGCVARIPAGPLVVRSGRQEIAVGRGLAGRIRVRRENG